MKSSKGGEEEGSFSIQKFMLQILVTLNRAFWSWNWYKKSKFRVPGMFFNNCIEKIKTRHTLNKACVCISYYLALMYTSLHICNHIHYKKLQHNFPKMRGGGAKAVWNFSKKSLRSIHETSFSPTFCSESHQSIPIPFQPSLTI